MKVDLNTDYESVHKWLPINKRKHLKSKKKLKNNTLKRKHNIWTIYLFITAIFCYIEAFIIILF